MFVFWWRTAGADRNKYEIFYIKEICLHFMGFFNKKYTLKETINIQNMRMYSSVQTGAIFQYYTHKHGIRSACKIFLQH